MSIILFFVSPQLLLEFIAILVRTCIVQSVVSILNIGSESGSFSSPDLNIPYGVPILHILIAFSLSSKSGKYFINLIPIKEINTSWGEKISLAKNIVECNKNPKNLIIKNGKV